MASTRKTKVSKPSRATPIQTVYLESPYIVIPSEYFFVFPTCPISLYKHPVYYVKSCIIQNRRAT